MIASVLPAAPVVRAQSDVATLLEQARAAEKTGDYQAAERVYFQALALAPGNLETLKRLGILQQTELKFGESIESFKKLLAHEAQYPEVNFFLGVSYTTPPVPVLPRAGAPGCWPDRGSHLATEPRSS